MKTVLTIDESRTMRDMLMMALVDAGYRVIQAVDGVDLVGVQQGAGTRLEHHVDIIKEDDRRLLVVVGDGCTVGCFGH